MDPAKGSRAFLYLILAQRQDGLAELSVEHLTHSTVDSGKAAEDANITGNGGNGVSAGEVTDSKQEEQQRQGAENYLSGAVVLEGTDEHKQGEDAPQEQIPGNCNVRASLNGAEGVGPDENQRPPEKTVSGESGAAKGVALAQFTDTGNDLSQTAQADTHGNDNDAQRQQTGIVQVKKYSSHTETQQAERAGVCDLVFHVCRHFVFLQKVL